MAWGQEDGWLYVTPRTVGGCTNETGLRGISEESYFCRAQTWYAREAGLLGSGLACFLFYFLHLLGRNVIRIIDSWYLRKRDLPTKSRQHRLT